MTTRGISADHAAALDAIAVSLLGSPRPALGPEDGDEAFTQHLLLTIRIHRAALLNKSKTDRDGEAWGRFFREHFVPPVDEDVSRLLWREWRTKLVKEDTPGRGVAITHGIPQIHWKQDARHGLCIDLESMWSDFETAVDHFLSSLRADSKRRRVVIERWKQREWRVVSFVPAETVSQSASLPTAMAGGWHGAMSLSASSGLHYIKHTPESGEPQTGQ